MSAPPRSFFSVAEIDPSTTDLDGRLVVFDAGTRLHLALGRPELADEHDLILGTSRIPTTASTTRSQAASTSIDGTSIPVAGCA
jgi:hypothetical protein